MSNAALLTRSVVHVDGRISGPGSVGVFIEGFKVGLVGDLITQHYFSLHSNAVLAQGSSSVFIDGRPASRVGDLASCGGAVETGALTVYIGG